MYKGVRIPLRDRMITGQVRSTIVAKQYEIGDVRAMLALLEADDVLLEVGAGIGFISCLAARRLGDQRVFAYEANPAMLGTIERLHRTNGVSPSVIIGAVGAQSGEATLAVGDVFWDSTLVVEPGARGVRVPVHGFTEVVERCQATFVMLDCEGSEREIVLEGNDVPSVVRKLCVELHPHIIGEDSLIAIREALLRQGFRLRPELSDSDGTFLALVR